MGPALRWTLARRELEMPLKARLVALALLTSMVVTVGLAPRAEATIAKDITDVDNGTKLGSIGLPAATGSSATDVTFELTVGGQTYDQSDIVSISWNLGSATPSLSLKVDPNPTSSCSSATTDGPCTKKTIQLSLSQLVITVQSCPAPPEPPLVAFCTQSSSVIPVEFVDAAPAYACAGFDWPLDHGPVTIRRNLALPLKAELFDEDGVELGRGDLDAAPVVQVAYQSGISGTPDDVSDEAMSVGRGGDANTFVFLLGKWRYFLRVANFSAPGTYTITMTSGDEAEYRIDPTCTAQFIVNP